jgi:hypothetical protein
MAVTGARSTANQAAETTITAMDDVISMLDKYDTPTLNAISTEPVDTTRIDWLDDELDAQQVTVSVSAAGAATELAVTDSSYIRTRDLLRRVVPVSTSAHTTEQILLVTGVSSSTTVQVSATPWAGATANVADDSVWEVIGQVPVEGQDPYDMRDGDPSQRFNYTQIFQEGFSATRSAQQQRQFAITDPLSRAKARKMKELAIRLNRAMVYGQRVKSADSTQRTFGGLLSYITSGVTTTVAADLKTNLRAALKECYARGASPSLLLVSPEVANTIQDLDEGDILLSRQDTGRGNIVTDFRTIFGGLTLLVDRHLAPNLAIGLDTSYITRGVFQDWFAEPLAKTGDSDPEQIVGEFTMKVKEEKAHFVLTVTDAE